MQHDAPLNLKDTRLSFSDERIHDLIEAQVCKTPYAIAARFERHALTYTELNARANRLARHLRSLGVGPQSLVGLCVNRSLDMLVAVIAILKAGGAYVPLDPEHPPERLAYILGDARLSLLVTESYLKKDLRGATSPLCFLDEITRDLETRQDGDLNLRFSSKHLAYVIYTSGSTGKPKGTGIEHRSVTNLLYSMQSKPGILPTDVVLAATTLTFDISVAELFLPLTVGACVCIFKPLMAADNHRLATLLDETGATFMQGTPATWRLLLNSGWRPGRGQKLICGGEAMTPDLARKLLERSSSLWNMYGPTETTVWSSLHEVESADGVIPIGRPLANTSLYVLSETLEDVANGATGELFIGGSGLSRGYLNQPALTAERFVPDPFCAHAGARMYRTGDLARFRSDGSVDYLGRADHQVKVRGYRIELGEVEAALSSHPALNLCAVTAGPDASGETQLVGYFVGNTPPDASALREFLKTKLPPYMIPAFLVRLDSMPLSPSGKIDRKALPAPERVGRNSGAPRVAPRNEIERALQEIWGEALRTERLGIHDHFFEIGGHSLIATQILTRIRSALHVDLAVKDLFDAPTIAGLAEVVQKRDRKEAPKAITRRKQETATPLSSSQESVWVADQLHPNSPLYNIARAVRMKGPLDTGALEKALNAIVARHSTLRTTYALRGGQLQQRVHALFSLDIKRDALNAISAQQREEELRLRLEREARRPFNLTVDLLIRATLFELEPDHHVLSIVMHHIASDGWSTEIFKRDLSAFYAHFAFGQPFQRPELPIEYTDFAVWQREQLPSGMDDELGFWKSKLGPAAPSLELPFCRPRPRRQTFAGALYRYAFKPDTCRGINHLGARESVTPFIVLLAGFQTLLHRYSGQRDISVGTPVAGRNRIETEELIGYFVNMVVLRSDLSGNPTFKEMLQRVRATAVDAYAHQSLPFSKVAEAAGVIHDRSRSPLFQAVFLYVYDSGRSWGLQNIQASSWDVDTGTSKYDLTLFVHEKPDGLEAVLEYNTDLYSEESMRHLLEHFEILMRGAVADPERRLADVTLSAEEEVKAILDASKEKCLHELVEEQAARWPDQTAVESSDRTLTYGELEHYANRWARELRLAGARPNTLTAVVMEKGWAQVMAVLAIHKSGAAYLPIDPELPLERIRFILDVGEVKQILTTTHVEARLKWPDGITRFVLDKEPVETNARPLKRAQTSRDLAYVIFTSGSTGKPKGVMMAHQGVVNTCLDLNYRYNLRRDDRALAVSSLSFDLSVYDIFGTLAAGATLVMPEPAGLKNPDALARRVQEERITVWSSVPAIMQMVVDATERRNAKLNSLRLVMLSGDWIPVALPDRVRKVTNKADIYSLGGATEASIWSVDYPIKDVRAEWKSIPYGRAMTNQTTYIYNESLERCPPGETGSLFIGGMGLAEGYWRDPEKTAERFFKHPQTGERLYRTGDLGRYMEDGNIEFLGRDDFQVKVNGFRIELGEIETGLETHSNVARAVVSAVGELQQSMQLIGYIVARRKPGPVASDLQTHLAATLPAYMIPTVFMELAELPLSSNGKVDRKALPRPQASSTNARNEEPAGTPLEQILAAIAGEVLQRERVGATGNLFELGANSLSVIQLVSRLRDTLEVELSLQSVFENPTVKGLAKLIGEDTEQLKRAEEIAELFMKLKAKAEMSAA